MQQKHYNVLLRHLNELNVSFDSLRVSNSFEEAASAWLNFLNAYQKIYFKLRPACIGNKNSKLWIDKQVHLLKNDKLLSFLQQARNAEQHGLEEVVASGDGILLGAFGSHGSYHIKSIELNIYNNSIKADATDQWGNKVGTENVASINRLKLIPVTNYGIIYEVPNIHKGQIINDNNVLLIAALAKAHMSEMLRESSQFIT